MTNETQIIHKIIKPRRVKCCECKAFHKLRNVANGCFYCPICWYDNFGAKKKTKRK